MALVIDASAVLDLLLHEPPYAQVVIRRLDRADALAAPHLLDAEVAHGLRTNLLRRRLAVAGARAALQAYLQIEIERYPHLPLIPRAFQLRDNATVYDALYLALAEALDAPLLTRDAALARVPGVSATVEVISGNGRG
jgi:predicted nucleic acid-binding protein